MRKLIAATAMAGILLSGCGGGGGSSSEAESEGEGTISSPYIIESNTISVDNSKFYRFTMAEVGCKVMIIPDAELRQVASYDTAFGKTIADLRKDGNYVVTATQDDKSILLKVETYGKTSLKIASNCENSIVPSIVQDVNDAGLYALKPIYEDATLYLSSESANVFAYDSNFTILDSGYNFLHTNNVGELNLYWSNKPFIAAFSSESVGL